MRRAFGTAFVSRLQLDGKGSLRRVLSLFALGGLFSLLSCGGPDNVVGVDPAPGAPTGVLATAGDAPALAEHGCFGGRWA